MNGTARPVALLLPGQGSQHLRMAAGLLDAEPVFAEAMDEALTALTDLGGHSTGLREDWLGTADTAVMDHVTRSQPLLFAVDYALGRLVLDWGVRPVALLGHSIGEVAAAVLSGVFTLRDAAALVHDRVGRLAQAPPGGMVAVAATQDEVAPFLTDGVVVGAVNALRQTVLAGLDDPLRTVTAALADVGFVLQRVPASTAFHSPSLAPAMRGAGERIGALPVGEPRIPVLSGYTARFLTPRRPRTRPSGPVTPSRRCSSGPPWTRSSRKGTWCSSRPVRARDCPSWPAATRPCGPAARPSSLCCRPGRARPNRTWPPYAPPPGFWACSACRVPL